MSRLPAFIITLLFLIPPCIQAQQLPYRQFSAQEGLADSRIFTIKQAPGGNLLVSTDNGLSVYDGYTFKNYYPKKVTGSNFVLDAEPLPDGRVLVNAYKGGLCFLEKGQLVSCTIANNHLGNKYDFKMSYCLLLEYDAVNNCVWCITSDRYLWRLRVNGNTLEADTVYDHAKFHTTFVDVAGGRVFFGTATGLYALAGRKVVPLLNGPLVNRLQWYSPGRLLLARATDACIYDVATRQTEVLQFGNTTLPCRDLWYDSTNRYFWIPGHRNGVQVYRATDRSEPYMELLPGVNSNYLYADSTGNTWCGSFGSGLFQFSTVQVVNYSIANGLEDNYITHLSRHDAAHINIACIRSYYEMDRLRHSFRLVYSGDERRPGNRMYTYNGDRYIINNMIVQSTGGRYNGYSQVFDLIVNAAGQVFTAGFNAVQTGGLQGGVPHPTDTLLEGLNYFKLYRQQDTLYVGSSKGLHVLYKGRTLAVYNEANGLSDDRVYDVLMANGQVYCATRSGVSIIRPDGRIEKPAPAMLGWRNANVLCADNRGGVWVGTMTGLFLLYRGAVYQFDNLDGFISNEVTALYCDEGYLYAGTTRGLSVAGLQHLYNLATGNNRAGDALVLQQVFVNDSIEKDKSEPLVLSPGQNNIRCVLGGVNFNDPRLYTTEYSLDKGQNWLPVLNRTINLASLNSGSYELLIRSRHRNDAGYRQVAAVPLTIRLPWYRQPLFIIGVALLLAAIFAALVLRYNRVKRKREQHDFAVKKQLLDLEQKAMAALLNPHFVFNAINSINYYIHNAEEEKYTRLLTDLSKLIRLNLNNTYKNSVSLQSELEIVALYVAFEKHRFIRHPLEYQVAYNSALPAEETGIPPMIIQPFVENAIWHGILPKQGGRVWITVTDKPPHYIEVAIHDDGVGPAQQEKIVTDGVRGTQLIQQRLNAYNQLHDRPISFSTSARPEGGCVVRLLFPVVRMQEEE